MEDCDYGHYEGYDYYAQRLKTILNCNACTVKLGQHDDILISLVDHNSLHILTYDLAFRRNALLLILTHLTSDSPTVKDKITGYTEVSQYEREDSFV